MSIGLKRRIHTLIRLAAAASLACATAVLAAQSTAAPDPTSKLATVLADLAQAVSQDGGRLTATRAVAPSVDGLPKSVQDAVRGRTLRLSATGDVQVYILLSAVTDEV